MRPEEIEYVLYRVKTQSFFKDSITHEYPASQIRSDMKKGGLHDPPSEVEIENFINWKKEELSQRILGFAKEGITLGQIRTWCEYSLDCIIPIPSLNQVTAEGILSRFDYFNHVINKIVMQEQLDVLIRHRRDKGTSIDINSVMNDLENSGIYAMQDEITRTRFYSQGDLLRILMQEEEEALQGIDGYVSEGLSRDEVLKHCIDEYCHIFKSKELENLIDQRITYHRISQIANRVRTMRTNEILNFINVVEGYQMYRITGEKPETVSGETGNDSGMLESLTLFEKDNEPSHDNYLFQLSQLGIVELRQLVKLLRAFLVWKGLFYFMKKTDKASSPNELLLSIIEAFSRENGIDSNFFKCFLY